MVTVILLQKSSSDGMAGLSGGGGNSILSGRASANLLTRATAILAICFMINSLTMAAITARSKGAASSIIDSVEQNQTPAEQAPADEKPKTEEAPSVPLAN